ncbi:MAG TPA: Hsp20/alpha crystallin family protein [Dehalococcoidia bacterium]|nr:Hsp20/alpha crystallin family protein [Dehalococcoidia bacterium]
MADITRWDPFAELQSLRQTMDRLFDDARPWRFNINGGEAYFPVDLYETNDEVVVKASLPGVKPEDIDISVTGQVLTLKGESKEEHEEKAQNYYRRERRSGSFVRQLQLPTDVEPDRAEAVFEHGVLRLTLPKAEAVKPRTIKVQARGMIEGQKA